MIKIGLHKDFQFRLEEDTKNSAAVLVENKRVFPFQVLAYRRQCGPVGRALALRSGDFGFKTRSDHSLNLFLVVPGSTSQLHL